MLIDLHAHAPHPGYYNQHPHWGPFFEQGSDGDIRLRVGHWILGLGSPERKAAVRSGKGLKLDEYLARWADPKVRLAGMDAAGQNAQVVSVPSHCYMYWTEPEYAVPYARKVNDVLAGYCAGASDRLMFWAHAPMNVPVEAAKELRRACGQLGAKGLVAGGANFGGFEFDSPELYPVWEALCDLDLPMFIHGYNQSVTWGQKANDDRYENHLAGSSECSTTSRRDVSGTSCVRRLLYARPVPSLKVYITRRRIRSLSAWTSSASRQEP